MKYSISNIAWGAEYDNKMYAFLKAQGIDGLETLMTIWNLPMNMHGC